MTTSIRKATASDVDLLIALSRRTIRACYRPFLGDAAVDGFIDSGLADAYVTENIGQCIVILLDDQIVGYSVCRDNLIDLMMIDHSHQRRGFGTLLLKRAEEMLFEAFEVLRLESFEGNHAANAFYRKHAWNEFRRYFDADSGIRKIAFSKSA